MNLAVDSLPLHRDVYRGLDYSGLQIHGLSHLPLHRAAAAVQGDGRRWKITLGAHFWEDGREISPAEYVDGLARLAKAQPLMGSFLKTALKRVSVRANEIDFEFSRPAGRGFFDWPNWMPYRPGHISGAYTLTRNEGGWSVKSRDGERGLIRLVSSPEENERLFVEGACDFSADTATPLDAVDETVRRRDTGLFGTLVYSDQAEPRTINELSRALGGLLFPPEIEKNFPSLRPKILAPSSPRRFRLSYDAFYPNREICAGIRDQLSRSGWQVDLCEDDYYRPRFPGDAKFMILRMPVNEASVSALWMAALPRARRSRAKIMEFVEQAARGAEYDWNWLSDAELAYPLFRIPSLHRARRAEPNPLLEVFA
jgi:hypothetical protein